MVLGYETSRLLVMQAACAKDTGVRNTRETSLAKWHATESAFDAANLAIQVHGAYGYSAEYPVERYFRNSRAPDHLRGHDADPQDDAGRARTRLPEAEWLTTASAWSSWRTAAC